MYVHIYPHVIHVNVLEMEYFCIEVVACIELEVTAMTAAIARSTFPCGYSHVAHVSINTTY